MNLTFSIIGKNQLHVIQALWEKLNELHMNDSIHFKDHYTTFSFGDRCDKFTHFSDDRIRIEVIHENNTSIGYCVSTIDNKTGEIDSIFIEENYRKFGLGRTLVENSIKWFKDNTCQKIVVAVAAGHESVVDFYKKLDFFPRMTYLQLKE